MSGHLSPTEAEAWRHLRVLVVDDVDAMRMVMVALLGQLGIREVREAGDASSALEIINRESLHLVLCDWRMPGMDGLELLKALRADSRHQALPFVIASAEMASERVAQALDAGAQSVLAKPYDATTLANHLRKALIGTAMAAAPPLPDLRSPLAAALGLAEGLLDDGSLAEEQRERLQGIEENLLGLLDALHLATVLPQIEQRRFELRTRGVPLRKLLERALRLTQQAFAHRELQWDCQVPGPLRGPGTLLASGDPLLCQTLFTLLLRECAQSAPAGSRVGLRIEAEQAESLTVVLSREGDWPVTARQRFVALVPGEAGGGAGFAAMRLAEAQRGQLQLSADAQGGVQLRLRLLRSQLTMAGG